MFITKTKKAFFKEVKKEIDNLKLKATQEEIDMLDFSMLDSDNRFQCIYGQMTGYCESERALELTPKKYDDTGWGLDFSDAKKNSVFTQTQPNFTPLEVYISMLNSNNADVIKYLKGEIETLNL